MRSARARARLAGFDRVPSGKSTAASSSVMSRPISAMAANSGAESLAPRSTKQLGNRLPTMSRHGSTSSSFFITTRGHIWAPCISAQAVRRESARLAWRTNTTTGPGRSASRPCTVGTSPQVTCKAFMTLCAHQRWRWRLADTLDPLPVTQSHPAPVTPASSNQENAHPNASNRTVGSRQRPRTTSPTAARGTQSQTRNDNPIAAAATAVIPIRRRRTLWFTMSPARRRQSPAAAAGTAPAWCPGRRGRRGRHPTVWLRSARASARR